MNGVLSGMPPGILTQDPMMDPRTAAMMQMGLGLMSASGPSTTPVSFGQALGQAGTQGMNTFQRLQQAQIAEEMRKRQMAMQDEHLKMQQAEALRKQTMPLAHGPGTQLFKPGEESPYYTVPFRPADPAKPTAPMTRKVRIGEEDVTQEYVDGKWQEVGRGPAFAKSVEGVVKPPAPPRPPKDYEWTDDTYSQVKPVKGGPKDTSGKDAARLDTAESRADLVIGKVDDALGKVGFFTTGLTGALLGNIPGTDAYDLRRVADTIKANIGFQELQAMREASPTGGALGQVAVQELNMLQAVLSSIDANQSPEELKKSLTAVKTHYQNWKNAVAQSQQQDQAAPGSTAPQAPARKKYNPKTGKVE